MTKIKKIGYRCLKSPEGGHLKGFIKGKLYQGRSFNGLYEITTEWASHQPTYILDKREFDKFFELIEEHERQEVSH